MSGGGVVDSWGTDDELPPPESGRYVSVPMAWRRQAPADLAAPQAWIPAMIRSQGSASSAQWKGSRLCPAWVDLAKGTRKLAVPRTP